MVDWTFSRCDLEFNMPFFNRNLHVTIRHWLPIITFCPVNNLPDLLYISVNFSGSEIPELYAVRKAIRKRLMWGRFFMEDAAVIVAEMYQEASSVQVRLAFNRHVVNIKRYL